MDDIAYRSRNVRETLVELKNTSELAVDLGYAAALYDLPGLAEEVLELEARVDSLQYPAKMALMLAAKRSDDAEQLVGIIQIVEAAVAITNAAADIAAIVVNGVGLPEEIRTALPDADEVVMRATVSEHGDATGRTLDELAFEAEAGVDVLAIRRDRQWNIAPDGETVLEAGDTVIASGSEAGVATVTERLTGEAGVLRDVSNPDVDAIERGAELVVELKNSSELAVGLSYAAILFDDVQLAREVRELENRSDVLKNEVETIVIGAGDQVSDPERLHGLLHLATASEAICDAAARIADIVLRDGRVHPVFGQAIGESDELVTTTTVEPESTAADATLQELAVEERTGMSVMAIHRRDEWILAPDGEARLRSGDVLIARGPEAGAETLSEWTRA